MNVERLIGDLRSLRAACRAHNRMPTGAEVCQSAIDALAKLQAERDEAREALRPTDYNTLGQIGKAALDVCLPILKAHWAGGGSASMNPSLEYLDVSMGKAAMEAASRALGGGE